MKVTEPYFMLLVTKCRFYFLMVIDVLWEIKLNIHFFLERNEDGVDTDPLRFLAGR